MIYQNNDRLREYLDRGAAGAHREHSRHPRFEFNEEAFAGALDQVCAQFPDLAPADAEARAAFRLLTSGVAPEVATPLPSRWYRICAFARQTSIRSWPWLKLAWAVAVLALCAIAVALLSALGARAQPTPQNMRAYRNALRGVNLLALSAAAPQQPSGIILQFQQGGSPLATRPAGLVAFNCSTGMSCSFSGTTFTLTSTGAGGSGCVPPGTPSRLLYDNGAGGCLDSGINWSGSTATAPSGVTLTYSGTGVINASNWASTGITNAESLGKIPIGNGNGTATWADPFVSGITPHDAVGTSTNPILLGGYAYSSIPSPVSTDGDAVRAWFYPTGQQAMVLTSVGGTDAEISTVGGVNALVTIPVDVNGNPIGDASLPLQVSLANTGANATAVKVTGTGGTFPIAGASTPTDAFSNPTTAIPSQSFGMGYNGTTWDMLQSGDKNNVAAATGILNALNIGRYNATQPTLTDTRFNAFQLSQRGELLVSPGTSGFAVTANAGTNLNTSALALESGGNLATIAGAVSSSVVQSNTKQVNGVATSTGAGAVGTGSQRVAVGQDTTTIAGSAPGTAGSASSNVVTVQGIASMTKLLVTPDANSAVNVAQINGVTPLMGNGASGTGAQRVTIASDSTGQIKNTNFPTTVDTNNGSAGSSTIRVAEGSGTGCYLQSAASTNSTSCKGSAGYFYGVRGVNTTTTTYYLRMYNLSAAPTCSSSTGFIESIPIPPGPAAGNAGGIMAVTPISIGYGTGIGFCFTGGGSSTDNTNAATGVYLALIYN